MLTMAKMIQSPVEHNHERWCECGRPKSSGARGCARCTHLDGVTPAQAEIIAALRGTDGLSVAEIVDELGDAGDSQYSATHRTVVRLVEQGRLRRYWRESDAVDRLNGHVSANDGHWVYALWGAAEKRRAA